MALAVFLIVPLQVHVVQPNETFEKAVLQNRRSALTTTLLQFPSGCPEESLLARLVALSYTGDPRMYVAERPGKVNSIVAGSRAQLQEIYRPLLAEVFGTPCEAGSVPTLSREQRLKHLLHLPSHLLGIVQADVRKRKRNRFFKLIVLADLSLPPVTLQTLAEDPPLTAQIVATSVARIVARDGRAAAAKGFLSAGPSKSFLYVAEKVRKRFF
jgi:translocator assembly and maintenance protein 41